MPYKESQVTGQAWQRCNQIVIDNRRSSVPSVRFDEETVIALPGQEVRTPAGQIVLALDPAREIALRNPETGEPTGEVTTYGAAYALLYSAYLDAALERDAAAAPAPQTPAEE
jgi:hypothetical protein